MKEVDAVHEKIEKLVSIIRPLEGKETIKASEFKPFSDSFYALTQEFMKLKLKIDDMEKIDKLPPNIKYGEIIK